jgi:hypothetical protein
MPEQKEQQMKRITKITTLASGLGLLAGTAWVLPGLSAGSDSDSNRHHTFTVDLAVDCRTAVSGSNRGDGFIINGKLFPAGTLPSGMASNDPTLPVHGVAPIGDWLVRGHHALPLPPALAQAYSSAPGDFATAYFILDRGRTALFTEAYAFLQGQNPSLVFTAVIGGVGRFSGAAGEAPSGGPIGFNATGCPNFRSSFNIVPGSIRGGSN